MGRPILVSHDVILIPNSKSIEILNKKLSPMFEVDVDDLVTALAQLITEDPGMLMTSDGVPRRNVIVSMLRALAAVLRRAPRQQVVSCHEYDDDLCVVVWSIEDVEAAARAADLLEEAAKLLEKGDSEN